MYTGDPRKGRILGKVPDLVDYEICAMRAFHGGKNVASKSRTR